MTASLEALSFCQAIPLTVSCGRCGVTGGCATCMSLGWSIAACCAGAAVVVCLVGKAWYCGAEMTCNDEGFCVGWLSLGGADVLIFLLLAGSDWTGFGSEV